VLWTTKKSITTDRKISEFFTLNRLLDENNLKISELKNSNEAIIDKLNSFEEKICNYVYKGMNLAYESLMCDIHTLFTLAKYDKDGFFLYFKNLRLNTENCCINGISRLCSDKATFFEYGNDNILSIPNEILNVDGYDPDKLADRISIRCKRTIDNLRKDLDNVWFHGRMYKTA